MRDIADDLKANGASLVALTPQKPEKSQEMVEKHNLNFPLLSDPGNAYAGELGLRFELDPEVKDIYHKIGIDLSQANAGGDWALPIPARIVVDSSGIVRATDIDVDYTHRPEPEKTLEDVKALG